MKTIRVLHISWLKRSDGELGGVEKFAWYLDRALSGEGFDCKIIGWNDYPNAERCANVSNPDKALLLGSWVEKEIKFDVAVSDGYWGAGITAHPVAPVVHGTWAEFHRRMGSASPWSSPEVQAQHTAFNSPNAFPVACSPASARELRHWHRRDPAATILHGVDLEKFSPRKFGAGPDGGVTWPDRPMPNPVVVVHAATNTKKGSDIIDHIAGKLGTGFEVRFLAATAGKEAEAFQRGDLYLHPSRHEGNAYALLEALAVGLPIVTSEVGLFESIPDNQVGRILPVGAPISHWAAAVKEVWGDGIAPYRSYARAARDLAYDVADYWKFRQQWRAFIARVVKGDV